MDKTLLLWLNQEWAHPWLDIIFAWVSDRVSFALPLALLLLGVLVWRFGRRGLWLWSLLVVVVGVADAVGNVLKHLIAQARPCYDIYEYMRHDLAARCGANLTGMPSNHALNFFTAAMLLAVITRCRVVAVSLFAAALMVALSRVYLGKHYPSQVAVSAVLGVGWGYAAAWLALKYFSFAAAIRAEASAPQPPPNR